LLALINVAIEQLSYAGRTLTLTAPIGEADARCFYLIKNVLVIGYGDRPIEVKL